MTYTLDLVALATSCLALYFIARAKKTYFLDSGFFIGIATVGFILYLVEATYSDIFDTQVSLQWDSLLIFVMACSVGFASYLLKGINQGASTGISALKRFISKPPLPFSLFTSAVCGWTLLALVFQPGIWIPPGPAGSGYYSYPAWFVGASVLLLGSFIGLPVISFYRQSMKVNEKTASLSMKIISVCWAMFGVSVFVQIVGGAYLPSATQSLGFVADSFLFVLIAFAFREPTVLARIITAGETVNQVVSSRSEVDTIVLYNTESDRKKLIETFIIDGSRTGQPVAFRVTRSEVPFYRAVLKESSIPNSTGERSQVVVEPIDGFLSASQEVTRVDISTTEPRELIDLDELTLERVKEIVNKMASTKKQPGNPKTGTIWALNIDGAQAGVLDFLKSRSPESRVMDLARLQDVFSSLLNQKHSDILGRRILLEYDPTSNYEDVVQRFVREFQTNVESVAIFTNAGSPVYREFGQQSSVRLFSFSTKTSTPSRISDEQVLLPERDTSLLLDAIDKLLQAHSGRRIGIVFEVLTYLVLSLGFEKAYGVISSIMEMVESELVTILVLVNSDALEPRTLSGIRGLFQSQFFYGTDGLKPLRLVGEESRKIGGDESPELSESNRRIEA